MGEVIAMTRLPDSTESHEMFDAPAGTFAWEVADGTRRLRVVLPRIGFIAITVGGSGWQWDGNEDAPTISPSIDSKAGDLARWHGFARAGRLEEC